MAERIAHPCAHPECLNPGTRLIWWRDGTTASRTWACDEHVAELRQERVDAGCTVMGGEPGLRLRIPMSTDADQPWLRSFEEAHARTPTLMPLLELAVPLRILELRGLGWEMRKALAEAAEVEIASAGDNILFRGAKKGDSARAFTALATGLAVLALQPGGVSFAGRHWEDRPSSVYVDGPPAPDSINVGRYPGGLKGMRPSAG